MMDRLELNAEELRAVTEILDDVEADFERLDAPETLLQATIVAQRLPVRIRTELNAFRLERRSGVLRIAGHVVDEESLGLTPAHWRERSARAAHREQILLLLYGSLVGDPFGWASQQDGRLIHDVVPIRGHENEQLGSSSESLLTWHTEDAFHPLRGDFLAFACLRNPYQAVTTVGSVDDLFLPESVKDVLFDERFVIKPDESHLGKNNSAPGKEVFAEIEEMQRNPDRVAVLFGDREKPYARADPYFMSVEEGDSEAEAALGAFEKAMDDLMADLVLEAGEFCFLDNHRVVHGRKPFQARHDGTDRWLKRINLTSDLRKSRAARPALTDRAVH